MGIGQVICKWNSLEWPLHGSHISPLLTVCSIVLLDLIIFVLFLLFFFPSWCCKIPYLLLIFCLGNLLLSFLLVCWWQILLVFLNLRKSWFPLHSWRIIFLDIEFWIDGSFYSPALEKYCDTSCRPPWFLMANLLSFLLLFPWRQGLVFLWLLSRCFLCLSS